MYIQHERILQVSSEKFLQILSSFLFENWISLVVNGYIRDTVKEVKVIFNQIVGVEKKMSWNLLLISKI